MSIYEILLLSIGLSIDALAASIACGVTAGHSKKKLLLEMAIMFGLFQAIMPLLGYFLGFGVKNFVENIDHWVAFLLLVFVGVKMIVEASDELNEEKLTHKSIFFLAVATSIDALVTGITFNFVKVNIPVAILFIGLTTFILSLAGAFWSKKLSFLPASKLEIAGGIAITLIGLKILLSHLLF